MTTTKPSSTRPRKKINIQVGGVLLLPQSNDKHTLVYVLGLWPNLESIMSIALLSKEVSADSLPSEDLASFVSKEIEQRHLMAVVSTTTGTAQCGEWPKIGTVTDIDVADLLPTKPFETGSLVGAKHASASLVEGLVEAYRGLADWETLLPGRPGYLKSLIFDASANAGKVQ